MEIHNRKDSNEFEKISQRVPLRTHRMGEQESRELWQRITDRMDNGTIARFPTWRRTSWVTGLVAGVTLLVGAALIFANLWPSPIIEVRTEYGESRSVVLPDGSRVQMNGNSLLTYTSDWERHQPREVWFEGDGTFSVVHSPSGGLALASDNHTQPTESSQEFIVRMQDASIEVLGTVFDVQKRAGKIKVHLSEGRIRFSTATDPAHPYEMRVGEVVVYEHASDTVIKRPLKDASFIRWEQGGKEIALHNTSLHDVIEFIETVYGYNVALADNIEREYARKERIYGIVKVAFPGLTVERLADVFRLKAEYNKKKNEWTFHY